MENFYEQYKSDVAFRMTMAAGRTYIGSGRNGDAYEWLVGGERIRIRHNRNGSYTLL